jgi:hypothetical protein
MESTAHSTPTADAGPHDWALINNTRRQYVPIGRRGRQFEYDPVRYMRTALSLKWLPTDDIVMLPVRRMEAGYTSALPWPNPSNDAFDSASSSSSPSLSSDSDSWHSSDGEEEEGDAGVCHP